MITYHTFCQIRQLFDEKQLSAVQIAAELQLHLKTVEKSVKQTQYQPRRAARRSSKLDPFKGQIVALARSVMTTPLRQVFQELKALDYRGG